MRAAVRRKGGFAVLLMLALAMAPPGPGLAGADGDDGRAPPPGAWDADGDRIADDLEALLAGAGRDERLPVIAVLDAPEADPGARFGHLGAFEVAHAYGNPADPGGLAGFAAALTPAQVRALARESGVATVWWDAPVHAMMDTAVPSFGAAKARADFGVDGDGDGDPLSYSPADAVVCVIDTGIDPNHVDLDGGKILGWRDFINGRATPYDDNNHGTHVAATVAGTGEGNPAYKGVAPAAALVGVKVLSSGGSGSTSGVIAGVEWCRDQRAALGIEVISMSLGSGGNSDGRDALSQAVDSAADAGLLVVVAAGNSGPGRNTVGSPAAAAKALTVGAMYDTGERGFALAAFSSRGPTADGRTKPDIGAPGVAITSALANTGSGYATFSGTSMATPFTSGVAALLAAEGLGAQAIKDALLETAEDWGPAGHDVDWGRGRLRAWEAVRHGLGAQGTPPEDPAHQHRGGTLGSNEKRYLPFVLTSTQFPLALTLIMGANTNHNLYLYEPGADASNRANAIARSEGSSRQELIRHAPAKTGRYLVEVAASGGSGTFDLDASGALLHDTTAPATTLALAGTRGLDPWYTSPVTATLTATDDRAGVLATWYRLDGAPAAAYTGPVTIALDGNHTFEYWSVDLLDNEEAHRTVQVRIDAAPPLSSHALSGFPGLNGWYRSDVTATLAATDATSGVASLTWRLDGGAAQAYTGPLTLTTDGDHLLQYHAADRAGNVEAEREARVPIDRTPPATTLTPHGVEGNAGWWRSAVRVSLAAEDATSGVARTLYRLDDGGQGPYGGPFLVEGDGTHSVSAYSTDLAGNDERPVRATLRLDTTPPVTSVDLAGPAGEAGWWRGAVQATLRASDATSGVAEVRAALDGAPEARVTLPVDVAGDGVHRLAWRALDVAGNAEALQGMDLAIDATPPATPATFEGPRGLDGWWLGPVTVTLSPADATSGVASTRLRLDGAEAPWTSPVLVEGDGAHALAWASRDVAGNAEAGQAATLHLDATPPASVLAVGAPRHAGDRLYVRGHTPFTLTGSDATSGLRGLRYAVDGGAEVAYGAPFTLGGADGPRNVAHRALDVAGNAEAARSLEVFLDDTAPTVAVGSPRPGSAWAADTSVGPLAPPPPGTALDRVVVVKGARVAVEAPAADPVAGGGASGLARVEVLLDGALLAAFEGSAVAAFAWDTSAVPRGDHVLTARAVDRVGNAAEASVRVTVLGA